MASQQVPQPQPGMKQCKHCKSPIPAGAKVCPTCGKKQGGALKWVLIVLAAFLVLGIIGGAASGGSSSKSTSDDKPAATETEKATSDEATDGATTEDSAAEENESFKPIKLYDKDGITVTIIGENDSFMSPGYEVEIVNDSSKDVNVTIDDVSLDGTMMDQFFFEDVAAGKKAKADFSGIDVDSMDEYVNVEGTVKVINQDTYATLGTNDFSFNEK